MALGDHKQQTTVQNEDAIRIGSVKFEIGPDVAGLVDVGAIRNAEFNELFDVVSVPSDNAGDLDNGIRNHRCEMKGDWYEFNLVNLAIAYAGIGTHTVVAAAPVAITDEAVELNDTDLAAFTYKNGANTEVAAIVVADAATPTITYIRDCDYIVVVQANGFTSIARAYPTAIETSTVCAVTGAASYFLSAGAWDVYPAVGDHIYVAGFTEAANNGAKTVTAVTADTITVSETLTNEVQGNTITIVRGAIQDAATVYCDYTYTPNASRTYTTGGQTQLTDRVARFTNYDVDDNELRITVYKCRIANGLSLKFPSDDAVDPLPCPISIMGKLDVDRATGDQLFGIYDSQDD